MVKIAAWKTARNVRTPASKRDEEVTTAMPFSYVVHKKRRLVISTGSGGVTRAEIKARQDQTANDQDFDPEFDQIVDLTAVTAFDISMDQFTTVGPRKGFASQARPAFLASSAHIFGIGPLLVV